MATLATTNQINELALQISKVLKSGALSLRRSSKSQPFHAVEAELAMSWVQPPLLHKQQQNGAVPPRIW